MVICNTTICIDNTILPEWTAWMKSTYIPMIRQTGFFIDVKLMKVLSNTDEGGSSYALMMWCSDMKLFAEFEKQYSRTLDELHNAKYKGLFASFRTMLEEA